MSSAALAPLSGDRAARRRALDPASSFLAQAPAGSGKTELLNQRFLALLAYVEAPEAVVAITFTRKAAGEMQDRILGYLGRAQRGEPPEAPHERISYDLARAALEQDRRRGWDILAHPARLRIQTIDSLCAGITRQMPWLARLGAQPAVAEDASAHYREAARRTLALVEREGAWREALETVLTHLDNHVPRAAELIVNMLRFRDQWLPLAADGEGRRDELERAMGNAVTDGLARASTLMPKAARAALVPLLRFAASNLDCGHPLTACRDLAGWPGARTEDREIWNGIVALLLTGEGKAWRKQVDKRSGFPAQDGVQLYRENKQRMTGLLGELRPLDSLREALALIRVLPPARYTEAQWQVMQSLFTVLKLAAANLRLVFREQGEVDFCEIAAAARMALGEAGSPSELALGLDARIRHLLVDEFQDTSVSQFELIERLTAGWETGDGRTLFLVGDPMQSIYRFRQAEVGLFLKVAEGAVGEIAPRFLRLEANYRSVAGIVARVNEIFGCVFPEAGDIATGAMTYNPSLAMRPAGEEEPVEVHAFRKGEDAAEAQLAVELIRQARARDPRGTIAILVRARTHLSAIVPALKREGIAFRSIDIDRLGDRGVVRDLLALTRAMLHVGDRPSWLAVLRAPWCGLDLADLHALVDGRPEAAVWDLLAGDLAALSEEGRERARRVREALSAAFRERGRARLRRWVERTWWALGGPACVSTEDGLQDAADYLDLVEQHEQAGELEDFDGFRAEVDDLFAQPDSSADGTLQLMTIHKAKGLQFDTVIVPGLGRLPRPDTPALLLAAERPRPDGMDRLLAAIRETGKDQDPVYGYLRELERAKTANECIRLLYVACTRAKQRLHLMGHVVQDAAGDVHPASGSLLSQLWPGLREDERQRFRERYDTAATAEEAAPAARASLARLPLHWTAPPVPDPLPLRVRAPEREHQPSYLWVGDTLRHVGAVVHSLLQRIAEEGCGAWNEARIHGECGRYRAVLASLGVSPRELDGAWKRVAHAVLTALASERGRWILASRPDARCEYAVAGVLDGEVVHGTVDRTFVDEGGVRWIVDYKTSDHKGGKLEWFLDEEKRRYREQLERYARLLAPLGQRVRLGLYFPLLDAWREWAPETDEGEKR